MGIKLCVKIIVWLSRCCKLWRKYIIRSPTYQEVIICQVICHASGCLFYAYRLSPFYLSFYSKHSSSGGGMPVHVVPSMLVSRSRFLSMYFILSGLVIKSINVVVYIILMQMTGVLTSVSKKKVKNIWPQQDDSIEIYCLHFFSITLRFWELVFKFWNQRGKLFFRVKIDKLWIGFI